MERFLQVRSTTAPLTGDSSGSVSAVTISFKLKPGVALGDAVNAPRHGSEVGSRTIQTQFAGPAKAYEASLSSEPILLAAALVSVYLILAMLYESYVHPSPYLQLPAGERGRAAWRSFSLTTTSALSRSLALFC